MRKGREIARGVSVRTTTGGVVLMRTWRRELLASPTYIDINRIGNDHLAMRRKNKEGEIVFDIFSTSKMELVVLDLLEIPHDSEFRY